MKRVVMLAAVTLAASVAVAQLTPIRIEQLKPGKGGWRAQQFSPDGTMLYLSTPEQDGIWEYGLVSGGVRQLASDRGAGFGFAISPEGGKLAYLRRTGSAGDPFGREIVVRNLRAGTSRVALSGKGLSLPVFSRNGAVLAATETGITTTAPPDAGEVAVLGIENTKIVLVRGGKKEQFDPLGNGNYIWPSLSPDRTRILAYDMTIGAFVCDLQGNLLTRLGRRDAPVWTRDGRWIVYMDDRDDGEKLLSSEIGCVSPDGKVSAALTATPGVMEMFPVCSPTEDRIVCSTPDGILYSIFYKEAGR
jgi:Tol biopolymer transport system component